MKFIEAVAIMRETPLRKKGFAVHFEHAKDGFLTGDFFPDVRAGEEPIPSEEAAWELAAQFAAKTVGRCVNLYVINAHDYTPVPDYGRRKIENRK